MRTGGSGDYDFGQQLGRGSFGVVCKVRRRCDGRAFVCKQIQLRGMSKKVRDEANQEVHLLRRVSTGTGSTYIVHYEDHFFEGETLHIVMELCERGDLSRFLKARAGCLLEEQTVWKFLIQIALGLRWLHQNRILHRDIKTLNVFLTSANDVRLGDLGVARVLSHNTNFASTFVGTPYYLSPELCEERPYNELSDVWAFGCVVYEMCALKHPFEAKNQAALLIKILSGRKAPIGTEFSDDLRALIDSCMCTDWTRRMKLPDMLMGSKLRWWAEKHQIAIDDKGDGLANRGAAIANAAAENAKARGARPPNAAPPRPVPRGASSKGLARQPTRPCGRAAQEANAGPRARVRPDPRAAAGARAPAQDPKATLVAPGNAHTAAQVIRSAPGRAPAAAGRAAAPKAALPRRNSAGGGGGRDQLGEERRKAALEVAELPDIVLPPPPRVPRNVPSVHQLKMLEAMPEQGAGAGGSAPLPRGPGLGAGEDQEEDAAAAATIQPEEARRQAMLPRQQEEEATIRPCASGGSIEPEEPDELDEEYEQEPEESDDEPQEVEEEEELGEGGPDSPARAQGPSAVGTAPPPLGACELTHRSAFEASAAEALLSYTVDSLAYTGGGPEEEEAPRRAGEDREAVLEEEEQEEEEEDEDGRSSDCADAKGNSLLTGNIVVGWNVVEDGGGSSGDELGGGGGGGAAVTNLDSNGLLCDASRPAAAEGLLSRPSSSGGSQAAGAKMARLEENIKRLYAQVVEGLSPSARQVWDELYHLFQAKMAIDLTDEDQSEIERHVFERLPTESTDLIWKVYQVLHLEQERDRCQRLLASAA